MFIINKLDNYHGYHEVQDYQSQYQSSNSEEGKYGGGLNVNQVRSVNILALTILAVIYVETLLSKEF